ncbi:uncharacterized protein LOC128402030 isoform X2 [Podarcis raffonei]|uniref:uncharacterized protein LOC128402030 isoform X2 n=1 Tax=Podarcis raffonei TaxID=65483 RepID=UPI00232953C2|nr:uncharacterized protein LOC128402030 isoform X2 [Podarcis raffonei]
MVGRRRRPWLLLPPPLLLRALLLGFLLPGAPAQRVHHTFDNIKEMQIALNPTMTVQISSEAADNLQALEPSHIFEVETTNDEEKTLNNLVGLLQDMVKNIPTASAQSQTPKPTETATIIISHPEPSHPEPSPSEAVGTVLLNLNPKTEGIQVESLETVTLTNENTPTTSTAFWDLRNDAGASVVLHSDIVTPEGNTEEQTETSVFYSAETTPDQSLVSVSFLLETDTTTQKAMTFDQLTNGALASLVESLRNVRKMHVKLTHTSNESKHSETAVSQSPEKSVSAEILELIDRLIETIKNAPSAVIEDPALNTYLGKAESYLKSALELAGEAEKRLGKGKAEEVMEVVIPSTGSENVTVVIPSMEAENVTVVIPPSESEKVTVVIPHTESENVPVVIPHTEPEKVEAQGPPSGQQWVETEKKVEVVLPPLPSETVPVSTVAVQLPASPPESVAEKAEEAQVEMGKLKAFINLLYGFSPHLTAYAQNSANKKVGEDIVDRAMAVLHAIKSIFCGNPEGQSKLMLQQLLKEDMELVRQAMKEKRVS